MLRLQSPSTSMLSALSCWLTCLILTLARLTRSVPPLSVTSSTPSYPSNTNDYLDQDRKLLLKVDLWLIPWLSLLYLLSFLDRTNIGNARLAGMEADLGMTGSNYNMSLTIFFITYAVFEPLTNALLKLLTPRIFFTAIIIVWGLVMTFMGFCHNYSGLLAARFFLGIAEAGLFPG